MLNVTVALTGALPAVVIISAVLTAIASVFLLRLYQHAVVRAMRAQSGDASTAASPSAPPAPSGAAEKPVLTMIPSPSRPAESSTGGAAYRKAMQSLRLLACVYATGGLAYALVLTAAWMITAGGGFYPVRFLWLLSCYAWPVILAVNLITPADGVRVAIAYFAMIVIVGATSLVSSPDLTIGQLVFFWLFAAGPGTVLLLAFLNRRVRAVGPLVLAFMLAAVTGAFVAVNVAGSDERLLRRIVDFGSMLGLGGTAIFILLHLIGFVLFGIFGWWLLLWIGRRYRGKRMSDQSITLDALWLLFGVVQSFTLVFEGWGWIFTGAVAFAAYKLVACAGLSFLRRKRPEGTAGRVLLLLRVFALGTRSQRLFDALSRIWLRTGSINLIAGPDLATATVEPHEFLDFMGGHLSRRFVRGEADLEQRLVHVDTQPDPDGRFRVNEFFCRANTWQRTMQRLAGGSDAVLMDLRSFSSSNQGCIYELGQLMNIVPIDRMIFAIDDSTDQLFLETTMEGIWKQLEASSPNAGVTKPAVRCFSLGQQSASAAERLLVSLFDSQPALTLRKA